MKRDMDLIRLLLIEQVTGEEPPAGVLAWLKQELAQKGIAIP